MRSCSAFDAERIAGSYAPRNPQLTTRIEDLTAGLRGQAKGSLCAEAAAELLIGHRWWLLRADFADRFVEMVAGLVDGTFMAVVDWESALAAVDDGRLVCSTSESQVLRIAASLAVGVGVDLSVVLTGLDDHNVAVVVAALRHGALGANAGRIGAPAVESGVSANVTAIRPTPSRNDGVTVVCPVCAGPVAPGGRRRYCCDACRQAGHRRRHGQPSWPPDLPPRQPRRPVTVYECPSCEARRVGEQYCSDCATFMTKVGTGGCCPACDEPVVYEELTHD